MKYLLVILLFLPGYVLAERRTERIEHSFCQRSQGQTSTCWLHSAVQLMEQAAKTEFSVDALVIHEIRSRALIRKRGLQTPWDDGAGPTRPFALALEHGLVPAEVYQPTGSLIQNYSDIFKDIEVLLNNPRLSEKSFMKEVDKLLLSHLGQWPPKRFQWRGQGRTSYELAAELIGSYPSIGYDYRDVQFDETLYKKMGETAWTTIIDRKGELIKITDIIEKKVIRMTADQAWEKLIEKFQAKIPLAFTFIYFDHESEVPFKREGNTLISTKPPTKDIYRSSHLTLVSGLIYEGSEVVSIEMVDPMNGNIYEIPRAFFNDHGKTLHEVMPACDELLSSL